MLSSGCVLSPPSLCRGLAKEGHGRVPSRQRVSEEPQGIGVCRLQVLGLTEDTHAPVAEVIEHFMVGDDFAGHAKSPREWTIGSAQEHSTEQRQDSPVQNQCQSTIHVGRSTIDSRQGRARVELGSTESAVACRR
jgi:hypothetical protein